LYVEFLVLENFRNYEKLILKPDILNVFYGKNAQGKTNLTDAIFFGITGRSYYTEREREVIKWGNSYSKLYFKLREACRELVIEISLSKTQQKKVKVNGSAVRGYPLGWVGAVIFSPRDINVVQGPPYERRRFIDQEWGPFIPYYEYNLRQYQRVVIQKNNLLRESRDRKRLYIDIDVWNQQLSYFGSKILATRLFLLKKINPLIRHFFGKLTENKEGLVIRYNSSLKIVGASEKELYNQFISEVTALKDEEVNRGQTLIGPHKDDISFLINGADARVYGSRGQQYTLLLALKMAQIEQWKQEYKECPVLLLDDILFDLDSNRRSALLSYVDGNIQTFITTIDDKALGFCKLDGSKVFVINNGSIACC
jgi:DNA replication and repair protein RecF